MAPEGADPAKDRIKVRMVNHVDLKHQLLDFALVHQTFYRGRWRDVTMADSAHDDEVHLHRYGRSPDREIENTEHVCPITCQGDVESGYDVAYDRVVTNWQANKQRWHDA